MGLVLTLNMLLLLLNNCWWTTGLKLDPRLHYGVSNQIITTWWLDDMDSTHDLTVLLSAGAGAPTTGGGTNADNSHVHSLATSW